MTQIEIQRKRGPGAWPWIIGLLVLALVVWGVVEFMDADDEAAVATNSAAEEAAPAEPVTGPAPLTQPEAPTAGARFQAWVRDSAAALEQMGRQHEYTREGLQRLRAALEELIAREQAPELQQRLEQVREQVQQIEQSEPTSSQHAGAAQQAFTAVVGALETLRQQPHLQQADMQQHVDAARQQAESLQTQQPLLEQRAIVHQFFEAAGAAIQAAEREYLVNGNR